MGTHGGGVSGVHGGVPRGWGVSPVGAVRPELELRR